MPITKIISAHGAAPNALRHDEGIEKPGARPGFFKFIL